jgi:hypothetical protein
VRDIEGANFCEEFEFTSRGTGSQKVDESRKRFDQLFGC